MAKNKYNYTLDMDDEDLDDEIEYYEKKNEKKVKKDQEKSNPQKLSKVESKTKQPSTTINKTNTKKINYNNYSSETNTKPNSNISNLDKKISEGKNDKIDTEIEKDINNTKNNKKDQCQLKMFDLETANTGYNLKELYFF